MMAQTPATSQQASTSRTGFPQRWLVWALVLAASLGVAAALGGELAPNVFGTLIYFLFVLPILLPAWMLGNLLTHPFARRGIFQASPWPAGYRALLAVALGLGAIALATLAQGTLHLLSPENSYWPAAVVPAIAFHLGLPATIGVARAWDKSALRAKASRGDWLFLVAAVPAAMLLISATFPAGSLWTSEGNGYDVLEYHLELPREYALNNSTAPLTHNIYSFLPANVEMLYTLQQQLAAWAMGGDRATGHAWGDFPAQFLHLLLTLMTAAAIALAPLGDGRDRSWLHPTGRAIAVILFLGTPWTIITGSLAYNDMGMMFFGTLALGIALAGENRPQAAEPAPSTRLRAASRGILLGLLLGLAVGCKMTAGIFFALPAAAVIAWRGFTNGLHWKTLALAVAVAAAVYAPWALRALAASRADPVFPVATSLFGRGDWPADLAARFDRGHAAALTADSFMGRLAQRGKALIDSSVMDAQWSVQPYALPTILEKAPQKLEPAWKRLNLLLLILPLAIGGAFALRAGREEASLILAVLVIQILTWMFLTHEQPRFLLPMAVPLALLAGRAAQGLTAAQGQLVGALRIATGTVVGVQALCAIFLLLPEAGVFGGVVDRGESTPRPPLGDPFARMINVADIAARARDATQPGQTAEVPPEETLLLGDAAAYHFQWPVRYFTVFDVNPPLDALSRNDPAAMSAWLHHNGVRWVLVSWSEMARLQDTYGLGLDVPPRGPEDKLVARTMLIEHNYGPRLVAAGLEQVYEAPGITIYRVPQGPAPSSMPAEK